MLTSVLALCVVGLAWTEAAAASQCISDAELEAAVGDQIRGGAFSVSTAGLREAPLCSGLTIANGIQKLTARLRPSTQGPRANPAIPSVSEPPAPAARHAAPEKVGVFDRSGLIGAWVPRGESCEGDVGIIYEADGRWSTVDDSGTWSLTGSRLTMITLEEYDSGRTIKLRTPRRDINTIMSMSDREIHQRYGDGSSLILEKCLDDAQTAPIETQASVGTDRPVVASDINGARAGMVYSDVRRRLLAAGFKPEVRPKGQFCGYSTHCKLPETDACSGTGRDQCSYNFVKGGTRIYVLGVDGVENRPESQTVTAILYW